jgi:hypothetical protein
VAGLLATMLLAGCTRPTTAESQWSDGVKPGATFSRIVLVGVSPNFTNRCRFERLLQESLGPAAITSCSRMTSQDPLTREAIVRIVGETGADAVLSTRLVDGRARLDDGTSSETRGENYYKPTGYGYDPYYGPFGVPVVYGEFVAEQPALTLTRTVVISSNLYDAKTAAMIYSLDTVAHNKESQFAVADEVTVAIAKQMRRDGLIR